MTPEQMEEMIENLTPARPMVFDAGDYRIDANELMTDDLAYIFMYFKKDKKVIKDLVKYVETLPYGLKLDMMFYFGQNKKDYKQLLKIKSFNNMIDGFASSIADIKQQ